MIYYTGDIHAEYRNPRKIAKFAKDHNLTEDDVIVILGDVGVNYYGEGSVEDHNIKCRLSKIKPTLFCIQGNHEERPKNISTYRKKFWKNGYVYVEDKFPKLLFAIDGMIYDLDGKDTLVIGGAYSVDKWYRIANGYKWFEDEQPDDQIKQETEQAMSAWGYVFDQILSHTCPYKYLPTEAFLPHVDQSTVDQSTEEWLDTIEDRCTYGRWLCGHYHIDKEIDNIRFMYNDFIDNDGNKVE